MSASANDSATVGNAINDAGERAERSLVEAVKSVARIERIVDEALGGICSPPDTHGIIGDGEVSNGANGIASHDGHGALQDLQDLQGSQPIETSLHPSNLSLAGSGLSYDGAQSPHIHGISEPNVRQLLTWAWLQHDSTGNGLMSQSADNESESTDVVDLILRKKPMAVIFDSTVTAKLANLHAISDFSGKAFSEPYDEIDNQEYISKDPITVTRPDGGIFERRPIFKPLISREPLFIIKNQEHAKADWSRASFQLPTREQMIENKLAQIALEKKEQEKPLSEYKKMHRNNSEEKFALLFAPTVEQYPDSMNDEGCVYLGENFRGVTFPGNDEGIHREDIPEVLQNLHAELTKDDADLRGEVSGGVLPKTATHHQDGEATFAREANDDVTQDVDVHPTPLPHDHTAAVPIPDWPDFSSEN